jgi:hypothetical protein
MKSTLTRRALVASTAAIPAAAALPLPAGADPAVGWSPPAMTELTMSSAPIAADPILAAIKEYRRAVDALNAGADADGPQYAALERAFGQSHNALLKMVPTTLAGLKTKIAFFMNDSCLMDSIETPRVRRDFLDTLYKSACITARVS